MSEQNASKLILVVEEEKNMKLITGVLALAGHRFLKAFDGEEAIAQLKEHDPDIIIADLNMPQFNKWKSRIVTHSATTLDLLPKLSLCRHSSATCLAVLYPRIFLG